MRWQRKSAPLHELELIARLLRPALTHPAARGLLDDAAVLTPALGRDLVFTHDMLAYGIHYLPNDPPADVAHKLLAVNLSDLAAMGAKPVAALLGLGLSPREDEGWLTAFVTGIADASARFALPVIGGDTIAGLERAVLGLTAIGDVPPGAALSRAGARPGDRLWVSGNIGDASLGLRALRGEIAPDPRLIEAYRRPEPRLALGLALRGLATACMDVSDGLLLDARRIAEAGKVGVTVELRRLPTSRAAEAVGATPADLSAGGDDYELLFTAPAGADAAIATLSRTLKLRLTCVGACAVGEGLTVLGPAGQPIIPARLGFEHG